MWTIQFNNVLALFTLLQLNAIPEVAEAAPDPRCSSSEYYNNCDKGMLLSGTRVPYKDLCRTDVAPGSVRCFGKVVIDGTGAPVHLAAPRGFGPSDLRTAYNMPATGGNGATIAIVGAYHYEHAEADLVHRRRDALQHSAV